MLHGAYAKLSSEFFTKISMVRPEFWLDNNHRLKQIIGSNKYFGWFNVIATGDFYLLAFINKSLILQQTRIHGRAYSTATNIWKVLFKMYKLIQQIIPNILNFKKIHLVKPFFIFTTMFLTV